MIKVKLELTFDDQEEFEEFMEHEYVQGDIRNFIFAELCQNYGMGFLTHCEVINENE